jgi:double-GTPase-like protein
VIGLRSAPLSCPYCRKAFAERDIGFRCPGRPGLDGKRCAAQPDDARSRWLNDNRPLPPVFAADGRQPRAVCPGCGESTHEHVCPRCHQRLPGGFGRADHWPVVIVGSAQSGKTVLMTVLIHELSHRLGGAAGVAVRGLDDETLRAFHADYDHPLFEQHTLPKPSDPLAARPPRLPLVFELARTSPRWPGRRRRVIASFLDISGSDLAGLADEAAAAPYLTSARAVILVLDPRQLPGARGHAGSEVAGPEQAGTAHDRPDELLSLVTGLLLDAPDSRGGKIRKPVAVVVAKLDAVEHALAVGSPLTERPAARARFDAKDGDAVHAQAQYLIGRWAGPQFDLNLKDRFTRYRYFGLSALGQVPRDSGTAGVVVPHRVHDLGLWLLREFGLVGLAKRARGSQRRPS